jgi:hypothetical protein
MHPEEKEAKRVDMCPYTRCHRETLVVYSLAAGGSHRCSPSLMAEANLAAETQDIACGQSNPSQYSPLVWEPPFRKEPSVTH